MSIYLTIMLHKFQDKVKGYNMRQELSWSDNNWPNAKMLDRIIFAVVYFIIASIVNCKYTEEIHQIHGEL